MHYKLLLLSLSIFGISLNIDAQKVKRKGVAPQNISAKKEATADYSLSQLNGRWQEVKRIPLNSKEVIGFSDSLLIFINHEKAEVKDATSMTMSMKGEAVIDAPNILTVAGDRFNIRSLKNDRLILDDGEFIKEFEKKDIFYYETVGKLSVTGDSFAAAVPVDIKNIKGKWIVYRRQAAPGIIKPETVLIKSIDIDYIASDSTATGLIVVYTADLTESLACKLTTKAGSLQIEAGKNTWNFYSYKADANEFVFGDIGGLLYYSKHL